MKCDDPLCGHELEHHYKPEELGPIGPPRRPCRRCGCWDFCEVGAEPYQKPKSIQLNPRNGHLEARYGRPFQCLKQAEIYTVDDFKRFFVQCQPCSYVLRAFTTPNDKVNEIMLGIEEFLAPLEKDGQLEPVEIIDELTVKQVEQLTTAINNQFKHS